MLKMNVRRHSTAILALGKTKPSIPISNIAVTSSPSTGNNNFSANNTYNDYLNQWNSKYRLNINDIVHNILLSVSEKVLKVDINIWKNLVNAFRRKAIKSPEEILTRNDFLSFCQDIDVLLDQGLSLDSKFDGIDIVASTKKNYSDIFMTYIDKEIDQHLGKDLKDIELFHKLCSVSDLRLPHQIYAQARLMKRKIIFHGGPTNSGKTYHALRRLEGADPKKGGGLYCGPLRLLALEVYEQLNRNGVYTDLLTGQEQRSIPFSTHISCTIEMCPDREFDVAVIDEIQMISDENRGYAWTKALNGLRAREVHVCGGLEAAKIVQTMAEANHDDFELFKYERLTPLKVSDNSLFGDYSKCRPGDCVVAFSKAEIFAIKKEIEKFTPFKCSVIYGQLPPETRSMQARLFNEGAVDILVASDAVGMGLNLNIRRTIFHSVVKRGNGISGSTWIHPSNIKQIAGRAGRRSSNFKYGEVTTWQEHDLAYVKAVLDWEIPDISSAGLFPTIEQVAMFSDLLGIDSSNTKLGFLMEKFTDLAQMDGKYFLCNHDEMVTIANWLHSIPLTLKDKFIFCSAPVNTRDGASMYALYYYASMFALNRPVVSNVRLPTTPVSDLIDFSLLCSKHSILDLYLWLSFRFPKIFIERELSKQQRTHSLDMIEQSLRSSTKAFGTTLDKNYRDTKRNLSHGGSSDGLPPEAWPDVRNSTREYLKNIPPEKLYCFPHAPKL